MKKMIDKFCKDTSGNFAMMFGLALLPVMLGAGMAVDYTRYSNDKGDVQSAMDIAVLAGAKELNSLSNGQIKQMVKDMLEANLKPSLFQTLGTPNIVIDRSTGSVTGSVDGSMDTAFMKIAGYDTMDYNTMAQVRGPGGGAEIVLALDNTGSMGSDGKLASLKSAAIDFVDTLIDDSGANGTKIGIVPFSNHVNVGLDKRGASWLEVEDDSEVTEPNICYMTRDVVSTDNCRDETRYNDGVPYIAEICDNTYGPEYEVCGPRTTTTEWKGCVGSRPGTLSLEDADFTTEKVPGLMNTWCSAPVTPLSTDKADLKTKINEMSANGETYIPSGLTWGMRLLSNKEPFNEGVTDAIATSTNIKKFLVLMSDGDNFKSANLPYSPGNWGNDLDQANDWTADVCDNIKDEDVIIFTISFGTLTSQTKNMLKACATTPNKHYFHAATAGSLQDAFSEIGKSISALRLTM